MLGLGGLEKSADDSVCAWMLNLLQPPAQVGLETVERSGMLIAEARDAFEHEAAPPRNLFRASICRVPVGRGPARRATHLLRGDPSR